MEKQIRDIIGQHVGGTFEAKQKAVEEILLLFSVRQRIFTEWLRKNFQNNIDDESLWEDYNMIIDRPPKMYTSNELINWYDQYVA